MTLSQINPFILLRKFVWRTILGKSGFFRGDRVKAIGRSANNKRINGIVKKIDRNDHTVFVSWKDGTGNWIDAKNLRLMGGIEFDKIEYIYCEDCKKYLCLGKIDTIQQTKHKNHNYRQINSFEYLLLEKEKIKITE